VQPIFIWSDAQNPASTIDSWSNFRVNNYAKIDSSIGDIKSVFVESNELYVQTEKGIASLRVREDELETLSGDTVFLGTGNFLDRDPRQIKEGLSEGFAGTINPRASRTMVIGHVSIDQLAAKIHVLAGRRVLDLGQDGISKDLREHLPLRFKKDFPNYPFVDNIRVGYALGYDPDDNRLVITKHDYALKPQWKGKVKHTYNNNQLVVTKDNVKGEEIQVQILPGDPHYFDDISFTLSYDITRQQWIGAHSYIPDFYAWDRRWMYMVDGGKVWRLDNHFNRQQYMGKRYPFIIKGVITGRNYQNTKFGAISISTELVKEINRQLKYEDKTFTDIVISTISQTTGKMRLRRIDGNSDETKVKAGEVKVRKRNGKYHINNYRVKPREIQALSKIPSALETINIQPATSSDSEMHQLEGEFLEYTLIFDNSDYSDYTLYFKHIFSTDQEDNQR
jgi:hypothetical protein